MLELNFNNGGKNILVLHLDEAPGSKPVVFSGDDSWFDYDFQPYSRTLAHNVSCSEAPEEWALAVSDSYIAANSSVGLKVIRAGDPIDMPPQPSNAVNYNSAEKGIYNGRVLSGWWRRAGALIVDGVILSVAMIPFFFLFLIPLVSADKTTNSYGETTLDVNPGAFSGLMFLGFILAIGILYFCLTMARKGEHNGQTWGKQIFNLTVIKEDGEQVNFGFAFTRQILVIQILFGIVGALLFYIPYILNYLWPLWDEGNQALHDKIVKSRVIRTDI